MSLGPLPIDPYLPDIVARVRERRALVLTAAPGAGKTTRVPPALATDGPVIVLQPRRIAARSIARRIAEERGWTAGREVGWHVRFERQFSAQTRVLLATEGILTRRLQQDPLLSGFVTVVLDEFHERSIHADLGLALVRQAWLARPDLRIVVMSATIDSAPIASYLDGCPVIDVPGALHPIDIRYAPSATIAATVREALSDGTGQVLCFLPGAPEIRRVSAEVAAGAAPTGAEVIALHGSLSAADQDAALAPAPGRRVILATNIAETSVTVPGVRAVVDTGLHKVARYDPDRAIDSLETERISLDSARQRAGRAGRLGPGTVWRLWASSDRLRPHGQPEIHRIDLAGPVLEVLAWGGDPRTLDWFDPPGAAALVAAFDLLERLGAVAGGKLTPLGTRMEAMPLHPRLARILIEAGGARAVAVACALLTERRTDAIAPDQRGATTTSDLLTLAGAADPPPHVQRVARELEKLAGGTGSGIDDRAFRRALLAGYPDRVGKRRAPGSARVLLASGHGAVIGPESGVRDAEYLVALDVTAGQRGENTEARIRIASQVDREWLQPTDVRVEHVLDAASGSVRAAERDYYGALVLTERPIQPDLAQAAALLATEYLDRGLTAEDEQVMRRLRFAGIQLSVDALVRAAAHGARTLKDIDLAGALDWSVRQTLDRDAPARLPLPGQRSVALDYRDDGVVVAEVKLQWLFGVRETPRIGARREPVLLALLAPNGRPVQLTHDLESFWSRTYHDVRKELRGRYPKHAWPENPFDEPPRR